MNKEHPSGQGPAQGGFPVVGIGASAGGLAAFEAFFSGMPEDREPGMAFVLVQHLAPDHKSILTALIQRNTRMQVFEVTDGMTVQINCAYIIPPGFDMEFMNGCLHLLEPSSPHGKRLTIDFFFRSLARDQQEKSIAIVLSGTGSDGSLGVRAVKGEGGMVMAQTPASCEYDSMPRNAIATGTVDFELPPAEMAASLIAFSTKAFVHPDTGSVSATRPGGALQKIFRLLKENSGHDFSQYKNNTIMRRIERRMAVHGIDSIDAYVRYLQEKSAETELLFRDLLIGVTNFFRDPEAFSALETQAIPKLFENKNAGSAVRVWVPGCSTGEEAYSIAILLMEHMDRLNRNFLLQVFATDIDSRAIAAARAAVYPASIASDISAERLSRFFTAESDTDESAPEAYRINKNIRDILIFSEQDVIKDPPFSKLDLVSCRNLMIYLGVALQKRLIPLFHYALNPQGMLFLGSSETVGDYADHFVAVDRKAKIYQSRQNGGRSMRSNIGSFLAPSPKEVTLALPARKAHGRKLVRKEPLREITEQTLLKKMAPSCALVNGKGDIFYLQGRTGMYLEPVSGVVGAYNILKMAREGLKPELTTALVAAVQTRETVQYDGLRVKTNGHFTPVDLKVCPAEDIPADSGLPELYLVILQEGKAFEDGNATPVQPVSAANTETVVASLRKELKAKEAYLQSANEELETSNEELKSTNEEMQSINEELQSTNEELETSKEELQSVNEELATVNAELQTKVADLSAANNDMNNLLAGTGIATVFVDFRMRILRFTPTAKEIINLVKSDIGRPINHFVLKLIDYDNLIADIQSVFDTLVPKELAVKNTLDRWFTMRILPYRTINNVIEGAVITFVDISEKKKLDEALETSDTKFRALFEKGPIGVAYHKMIYDDSGKAVDYLFLDANTSYRNLTGVDPRGKLVTQAFPGIEKDPFDWIGTFGRVARTGEPIRFEQFLASNGRWYDCVGYQFKQDQFVAAFIEITERKQAEEKTKALLAEKELILKEVNHRIKNNMNSMKNLILLQAGAMDEEVSAAALEEAGNRMQSMEILYDQLYQSASFSELSINAYLPPLVDAVIANYSQLVPVKVEKQVQDFILDAKRLQSIGIIVNELLSNCMKYAFPDKDGGRITVSALLQEGRVTIAVQDNGTGMPDSVDFGHSTGFGLTMVHALAGQLNGTIRIERAAGTRFVLEFDK